MRLPLCWTTYNYSDIAWTIGIALVPKVCNLGNEVVLLENTIHLGDCLELMKEIPDSSVNLVLCDLPYGSTHNRWDSVLPLKPLWEAYKRILKPTGCVVLTSQMPYSAILVTSNLEWFKTEWIWEKSNVSGFLNAKKYPLKTHESILVFSKNRPVYNPQMVSGTPYTIKRKKFSGNNYLWTNQDYTKVVADGLRYPKTVIPFKSERGLHPTQKPVALFEYLIKTYTNPGDLVLDNCAGSGTTAVACKQTGRRYLCIEKDREYWLKACERVNQSNGII